MKMFMNIICKKDSTCRIKKAIDSLNRFTGNKLIDFQASTYWKEETCDNIEVEMLTNYCKFEEVDSFISLFIKKFNNTNLKDLYSIMDQQTYEVSIYASIDDVLSFDKIFLNVYAQTTWEG